MQNSNDISFYIQQSILWNQLPSNIRSKLGNDSNEYSKAILNYSLQNQLRFKTSLISKVTKNERKYYEKLLVYSREHMFLYPYHLQDIMVSGLRATPFTYYIDMLCQIMSQERSYDFIPNFTAADCLRLLSIGRNQYIDLMNTLRGSYSSVANTGTAVSMVNAGRRLFGFLPPGNPRKALLDKIRCLLPQSPVESIIIEPWWLVSIGIVLEPDIEACSSQTKEIIDLIIDKGPVLAASLERDELKYLYLRGMVYLDVPIEPSATISVPTLEGFVMNRTTGDYFETLLYKIFVAIDENTSVDNLSQILQIPLHLVQQAVSVFCRLQFAHKKAAPNSGPLQQHSSWHGFTSPTLRKIESAAGNSNSNNNSNNVVPGSELNEMQTFLLEEGMDEDQTQHQPQEHQQQQQQQFSNNSMFASPSLNSIMTADGHQVSSPSIDDFLAAGSATTTGPPPKKIAFIFDSSLTAYLMMGNLSVGLKNHAVTMFEVGKLSEESLDSFLLELASVSDVGEGEAQRYYEHAVNLRHTIRELRAISRMGTGVDLLRCGSLFSLDCASRTRMLTKNYKCLISMAPINYLNSTDNGGLGLCATMGSASIAINGGPDSYSGGGGGGWSRSESAISTNPEQPHFGPVIPEVTSVWFKLFLYVSTGSGPPSLLLTNGFRLRTIPKQFSPYSKLLITPWQQESVVIGMNCALVTINDALTHSPLLVQGYDLDGQHRVAEKHLVFPIADVAGSVEPGQLGQLVEKLDDIIDLSSKCGFISYLEYQAQIILLQMHFGVPLFDHQLNRSVLEQLAKMPLFSVEPSVASSPSSSSGGGGPVESSSADGLLRQISDRYQKSTRKLAIRLLEFIDTHGGSNAVSGVASSDTSIDNRAAANCNNFSEISLPTRNLFFHHGIFEYYFS